MLTHRPDFDIAQLNVGRAVAPLEDEVMAHFMNWLDEINARWPSAARGAGPAPTPYESAQREAFTFMQHLPPPPADAAELPEARTA